MKFYSEIIIKVESNIIPEIINKIQSNFCIVKGFYLLNEDEKEYKIEILYKDRTEYKNYIQNVLEYINNNGQVLKYNDFVGNIIEDGILSIESKFDLRDFLNDFDLKVNSYIQSIMEDYTHKNKKSITSINRSIGTIYFYLHESFDENYYYEYLVGERDSIYISKSIDKITVPLIINVSNIDDLFKFVESVASSYRLIRLVALHQIDELTLYDRMKQLSSPVISREYDEIPLYLIIKIQQLLKKYDLTINNSVIGFIGINNVVIRMASIFNLFDCRKVIGFDNSEKMMYYFEREGGISTTVENVIENSDIVIIEKPLYDSGDLYKLQNNQLLIFNCDETIDRLIIEERGIKGIEYINNMNSYILVSAIIEYMLLKNKKYLINDDVKYIVKTILKNNYVVDSIKDSIEIIQLLTSVNQDSILST